uniref:Toxin candidate TRINITY_DN37551_c1_g3_i1 n=1 Tax=Pachycerianthus maua TaxID=2736681 RepID=A0A7G7WZ07_9CNID|nr:toxin candidate TRINITY_DN37551_c1_g3_i1 [Pachycerianthus maua]QNH72556.1 toxin candidate TRINITY_DN37551_c1_g3_i1 [Pachycerianthus maua]
MEQRSLVFVVISSSIILSNVLAQGLSDPHFNLACLPVYKPVCGSDGKTYDSLCEVGVSNCAKSGTSEPRVRMLHEGHCTQDSLPRKKVKCLRVNRKKFLFC